MLTSDQIAEQLERAIAQEYQARNHNRLRELQTVAGVLMEAANYAGDKDMAYRFRVLAAESANRQEELLGEE